MLIDSDWKVKAVDVRAGWLEIDSVEDLKEYEGMQDKGELEPFCEALNPMKFVRHLRNAIRFSQLPRERRRLVFYSEGRNYWVHLEGIIEELLKDPEVRVCFLTSGVR